MTFIFLYQFLVLLNFFQQDQESLSCSCSWLSLHSSKLIVFQTGSVQIICLSVKSCSRESRFPSPPTNNPVYCLRINTPHAQVRSFWFFFWKIGGKLVTTFDPIMQFCCPSWFRILKTIFTNSVLWKRKRKKLLLFGFKVDTDIHTDITKCFITLINFSQDTHLIVRFRYWIERRKEYKKNCGATVVPKKIGKV